MTSNTDKNQLNEHADAGKDLTENLTSRSTDLENILNSLGHAVADNQRINSETHQEIMVRAKNIDERAGVAFSDEPFEDADIFGAQEDKISDVSDNHDHMDGGDILFNVRS